jgi:dynein heavy chain
VLDIAKQILKDLPSTLQREAGNKKLFETNSMGLLASLSTVLLQEMEKFNNLLNAMRHTLDQLQKAIKGFVVMSQELDQMYNAFINNQIPTNWKKVAYPSLKPLGSWYLDLLERVTFLNNWLMNDYPPSYWISGFYFPQGFMTGVLQTHARKYKIAIDKLAFKFKILAVDKEKLSQPPKDGVYIYGMFLDGARWDSHQDTLAEQYPGEIYTKVPVIHFIPTENYTTPDGDYPCPVYKTSIRKGVLSTTGQSTNFILAVDMPSKNDKPEAWTLKGTALLCQLDN